jgi:hypothetical protein
MKRTTAQCSRTSGFRSRSNGSRGRTHSIGKDTVNLENQDIFHSRPRAETVNTPLTVEDELCDAIKAGYQNDPFIGKIVKDPGAFSMFSIKEDMIYTRNRGGEEVVCVPNSRLGEYSICRRLIEQAHKSLGHFGPQRSGDYLRRWYWWPSISKEVHKFCESCATCKVSTTSNQPPAAVFTCLLIRRYSTWLMRMMQL